jgi:hypothetical protein
MITTVNKQALTQIFNIETRLDSTKLYEMLATCAQMAMIRENRCALISAIASVLSNICGNDAEIKDFISLQIDRKFDCGQCTRCDASRAASNA